MIGQRGDLGVSLWVKEGYLMSDRKQLIIQIISIAVLGISLITMSELENTRNVVIVQLIAFGMFLGAFIATLKTMFWKK